MRIRNKMVVELTEKDLKIKTEIVPKKGGKKSIIVSVGEKIRVLCHNGNTVWHDKEFVMKHYSKA